MPKVTWILHQEVTERLARYGSSLDDAVRRSGHDVHVVSWEFGQPLPQVDVGPDQPVVLFGGHPFVRAINTDGRFQPGALGVNDRTHASKYLSNLPLEWFLNSGAIFMTWAMFKQRGMNFFAQWQVKTLFIRPDSGLKTFAGQTITMENWNDTIMTLDQLSSVMPETMILVARPKDLQGEFRFVIADGQVVTGSEYRWDGKLDIRIDYPQECFEMAQRVAQHEWQVDIAYTCDVALTDDGPKVIELNGFSCAGLYACNKDEIVKHVSAVALKEFLGEDL